ncbi:MAG: hypothetical protein C7B43_18345 [Sulfobacillus benefaciens]|uniref:Type II toxin-antitoxin system HicB family antitoxin n=1 Tax=Sulfobacillus benefaciens TaxID=453960 RepID=A0A2T2WR46_9FIRM|nr:MAG: hypothetical protein C7B43_18345 [Sulfobacillus benefaciens]
MAKQMTVSVEIVPQEDSPGYLALCPTIPGCHAEGSTIGEALDRVIDVARALLEAMHEDGVPWPATLADNDGVPVKGQMTVLVK